MSGESASGPRLATLHSSLWLCDDAGGVYVLKNLEKYVDSRADHLQYQIYLKESSHLGKHKPPPPPLPPPALEWIQVGREFNSIAAGFEGIVCGLKHSNLYIRMGVSARVPQGTVWSKIICAASQVAIGKDCIARKDGNGRLFVANVRNEYNLHTTSSQPLVLENWSDISMSSLEEVMGQQLGSTSESSLQPPVEIVHFLLDHKDRLFIVLPSGVVFGCLEPTSEDNSRWIRAAGPPPIQNPKPGFLKNLYSYIRGEKAKEDIFSQVSAGRSSLWCTRSDNHCELWQLVVSDCATFEGVTDLKTDWSTVLLPAEDERAVLVAASKSAPDGIYAVMVKNCNGRGVIMAFSLNQSDKGRVRIELPSPHDPTYLVAALCSYSPSSSTQPHHHRVESVVCCESGDCEFCQNARTPRETLFSPFGQIPNILGKRPHPDAHLGEASTSSIGRVGESEEHHVAKRKCLDPRALLLEGVEVQQKPWLPGHHSNVQ